jgi:hypothetical protein
VVYGDGGRRGQDGDRVAVDRDHAARR